MYFSLERGCFDSQYLYWAFASISFTAYEKPTISLVRWGHSVSIIDLYGFNFCNIKTEDASLLFQWISSGN
jgi:hypothetical protein